MTLPKYDPDFASDRPKAELGLTYLKAVAAATVVFGLQLLVLSGSAPLAASVSSAISAMIAFAFISAVAALIPFAISVWIARKLAVLRLLRPMWLSDGGGLVTAVPDNDRTCKSVIDCVTPSFWSDAIEGFQFLVLPCVVGAVTSWIVLGRRLGLPGFLDSPPPRRIKAPTHGWVAQLVRARHS